MDPILDTPDQEVAVEEVKKEENKEINIMGLNLMQMIPQLAQQMANNKEIKVEDLAQMLHKDPNNCFCGKKADFQCPCKKVKYCSKECQRSDWQTHRLVH